MRQQLLVLRLKNGLFSPVEILEARHHLVRKALLVNSKTGKWAENLGSKLSGWTTIGKPRTNPQSIIGVFDPTKISHIRTLVAVYVTFRSMQPPPER